VDFSTYTTLTALFALFANALTVALLVVLVGGRFGITSLARARDWLRDALADVGVWLAATVATASTVGSLIYSEAYDLIPCSLCWYQRIAMYPLAVILIIAALKRANDEARRYGLPLALVGMAIATYHYLIQQFPDLETGACSVDVPCSAPYVWKYDFVSIPYMALAGFALVVVLLFSTERTRP
jgi:disulfide bond formation protein DsbB